MSIGFSGAHRTGKTTLAKDCSGLMEIPFKRTTASAVFLKMGLDPKVDYDFETRLKIQHNILREFYDIWTKGEQLFITDRTPLDLIAYTLADVGRETLTPKLDELLSFYLNECLMVLNEKFRVVIVVQPGIPMADAEGKAPATLGYVEHINRLILGYCAAGSFTGASYFMPRGLVDQQKRIALSTQSIGKGLAATTEPRAQPTSLSAILH